MGKRTIEEFKKIVYESEEDKYTVLSNEYINNKTPILIRHNECKHEYNVRPDMFVRGRRCPKCANKKRNKNRKIENYLEKLLLNSLDGHNYVWLDEYQHDNKQKLLIKHKVCNYEYYVRPNDFQQGYRCPNCKKINSRHINLIKKILDDNKIVFEIEKGYDDLINKRSLNFDIYIPKFNLLIEYDGLQHFKAHKSSFITKDKVLKNAIRDQIKNEYSINKNINLIRLSYKLKDKKIKEIMSKLINNNFTLEKEIIYENNIYYYQNSTLINNESYYTHINKNYFKDLIAVKKPD